MLDKDTLENLGFKDVLVGTELLQSLRVNQKDLESPEKVGDLISIAKFLNEESDPSFVISSVLRSNKIPSRSNLEHFSSFIKLAEKRKMSKEELENLDKELEQYK